MTSWTDDRIELLKKLWKEGQSASRIAKELGGVTRSAVLGKVHRLGLSEGRSRKKPATEKPPDASLRRAAEPKRRPRAEVKTKPTPPPVRLVADPVNPWDTAAKGYLQTIYHEELSRDEALKKMRERFPERSFTRMSLVATARGLGLKFADTGSLRTAEDEERTARVHELERVAQEQVSKGAAKLSLTDLTERTCRWPIGNPEDEAAGNFWFCGQPTGHRLNGGKSPYCPHHTEVAYLSPSARRRRS